MTEVKLGTKGVEVTVSLDDYTNQITAICFITELMKLGLADLPIYETAMKNAAKTMDSVVTKGEQS